MRTTLLSDRLALERRAVQARRRSAPLPGRAWPACARLLERAETDLASARDRSLASSFSPAAGSLLGAPSYNAGYVFPVGGGPSLVSVSHHHHDYPAADIAAPEGSPVYALSDAVVERAWQYPDGRCGIGLTLAHRRRAELDVLPPLVPRPGDLRGRPARGGHPGRARRLDGPRDRAAPAPAAEPATSYPQLQPWFQSFANVAFRWQDSGPTDSVPGGGRVFAIVSPEASEPAGPVVRFTR